MLGLMDGRWCRLHVGCWDMGSWGLCLRLHAVAHGRWWCVKCYAGLLRKRCTLGWKHRWVRLGDGLEEGLGRILCVQLRCCCLGWLSWSAVGCAWLPS